MDTLLIPGQRVHIIGIGGFGVSAIARVLLETGYTVSGSDMNLSPLAQALERDGAQIFMGHDAGNVVGSEIVIASSAIPDDNIEIKSAHALGIPVLRRKDAINMITAGHRLVAVAGTHGKTTTTALLTHTLLHAGVDPTYIVGGVLNNTFSNAGVGQGDVFVIEADEYGDMFLGLHPSIGVVMNIEYDHPDMFPDMKSLINSFRQFIQQLGDKGLLVACLDSPPVAAFATNRLAEGLPVTTYSLNNPQAEWTAANIETSDKGEMRFVVKQHNSPIGQARLNSLGEHNVQNALAVVAVARQLGVPFAAIADAFSTFSGTGRRSEIMGRMAGVTIINDYAHHPTAIDVTLKAWANHPDTKRIWAVWQPHTYNRLRALSEEFSAAFSHADQVLVTDVYSVREQVGEGLTASDMAGLISDHGQASRYSGSLEETMRILVNEAQAGDVIVILSAGDAPKIGQPLLTKLAQRSTDK